MKKFIFIMITALAIMSGCSNNEPSSVKVPEKGIIGKVTDGQGNGLSSVTISSGAIKTTSDSTGGFILDVSPDNGTSVIVSFSSSVL